MSIIDQIKARKARAQQSNRPETATGLNQRVADLMKAPPPPTYAQKFDYIQKSLGSQRKADLASYLFDKGVTSSQMESMSAQAVLSHNDDFERDKSKAKLAEGNPVNKIAKLISGS